MSLVTDQWSDASVLSLSSKAADKLWSHKLGTTREVYDSFSVEPIILVRRGHESESGQIVLKKVKLTYFDAYL